MYSINDIKKFMIQSSKDFCCPITKNILDYRTSIILRDKSNNSDHIVSSHGWQLIQDKAPQLAEKYQPINTIEEYA